MASILSLFCHMKVTLLPSFLTKLREEMRLFGNQKPA